MTRRESLKPRLAAAALMLAAIPPVLVFLDRWFSIAAIHNLLRDWWCKAPAVCSLLLPSYFLVIVACTLIVIGLVIFIGAERIDTFTPTTTGGDTDAVPRRQQVLGAVLSAGAFVGVILTAIHLFFAPGLPDWTYLVICLVFLTGGVLYTTPRSAIANLVRTYWAVSLGCLLGLAALSWLLFSYYGRDQVSFFALAFGAVSLLVLYAQRKRISPGYWLVLLALVLLTLQLNSWNFSVVGDAMAFLGSARAVAFNTSPVEIANQFFNGTAVYATHPYLSSILLAPTIKLFDQYSFGWRYGSILPSALAVLLFYYFFHAFMPRWIAFSAAFLLAVSHFLMTFSRIGYNNTQALLAMGVAFAAATWAIKSERRVAYLLMGLTLAFCFYVFPAALYLLPVVLWFLILYRPTPVRMLLTNWAIMLVTLLVLIMPLFFQPNYWQTKLLGTPFWSANVLPSSGGLWAQRLLSQFSYAFYSFLYAAKETHFLRVADMDGVTAVLVLLGLGVLLRRVRADKFALFVLAALLILLLLVGTTHGTEAPPNTRMFLLLPLFCLTAAIGLKWLAVRFGVPAFKPRVAASLLASVLLAILGLNLYMAYDYGIRPPTGYLEFDSLFVRAAQNLDAQPSRFPKPIVYVYDPKQDYVPSLIEELQLDYLPNPIQGLDASAVQPAEAKHALLSKNNIVILSPHLSDEVQAAFTKLLSSNGRIECAMLSEIRQKRFGVWRDPGLLDLCTPQQLWTPIHFPDVFATGVVALGFIGGLIGLIYIERRRAVSPESRWFGSELVHRVLPFSTSLKIDTGPATGLASTPHAEPVESTTLTTKEPQNYTLELNLRLTICRPKSTSDDKSNGSQT